MPELPEVEIVRRGLDQFSLRQDILGGDVLLARTIAHPFSSEEFLKGLIGTQFLCWQRRGKYLLAELVREEPPAMGNPCASLFVSLGWLGVHLRMSGQLLWCDRATPLQKHTRVRLFFPGNWELRFVDQRTFGQMWWVPPDLTPESVITGLQKLGPEPFSNEFCVEYLRIKLRDRQRPIKSALLDQDLVAGVGNIYADEALFLSQIHPETLCRDLNREQIQKLYTALLQVLDAGIKAGGTTFSTFLDVQGVNGNYGGTARVYRRQGEACQVCNTPIQRLKLAGRSTHFCPICQQPNPSRSRRRNP